jgi:hypothetical protein
MSNYRLVRKAGQNATGSITIVVDELETITIPNGASFEASGKSFATASSYAAKTAEENVVSETDRLLNAVGDGTYTFTIEATAVDSGTSSMISKDTAVEPTTSIQNFVSAYATSDFVGGLNEETNTDLLQRQQEGVAARALSNRINMSASLLAYTDYEDTISNSVIGFGDVEMIRDQHSLFPLSYGGRADWYVRTRALPQSIGLTKVAVLVSVTSAGVGTWQFALDRDEAPGFYDVPIIRPTGSAEFSGSFTITTEVRGFDDTAIIGELTPDMESSLESAFSRYQTTVIQFADTEFDATGLSAGETRSYDITVRSMPQIDDIQNTMASRLVRNFAGDVLVKSAIPCFLSLSFTLHGKSGVTLPDANGIADALANYVNTIGFCGRLYSSSLSDIIHNFLTSKISVGAIDMFGQVLRPDGTILQLRDTEELVIPTEDGTLISGRTVNFILDPANVKISADTVVIPEIQ